MLLFAKSLVKSTIHNYMIARLDNGWPHEDAIFWVLASRYPSSEEKIEAVLCIHSNLRASNELEDFAWLVVSLYLYEQRRGDPLRLKDKDLRKLMGLIEDIIESYI